MAQERLTKVIAASGVASRRGADRLVQEGEVTVNGEVILEPGTKVDPERDHIKVGGKLLRSTEEKVYVLVNKPVGMLCTPEKESDTRTLAQLLEPLKVSVRPVDRLDQAAEGLVLCTNDGDLAWALNRPTAGIPKTWLVKVRGVPDERVMEKLRTGVPLPDGRSLPMKVRIVSSQGDNTWLQIVTREHRTHLLKRIFLKMHHPIRKSKRTAWADLTGKGMPLGSFRWLNPDEIRALKALAAAPPGLADLKEPVDVDVDIE